MPCPYKISCCQSWSILNNLSCSQHTNRHHIRCIDCLIVSNFLTAFADSHHHILAKCTHTSICYTTWENCKSCTILWKVCITYQLIWITPTTAILIDANLKLPLWWIIRKCNCHKIIFIGTTCWKRLMPCSHKILQWSTLCRFIFILNKLCCDIICKIIPVTVLPRIHCKSTVRINSQLNHLVRVPDSTKLRVALSTNWNNKFITVKCSITCISRSIRWHQEFNIQSTVRSFLTRLNFHSILSWLNLRMCPSLIVHTYECLLCLCKFRSTKRTNCTIIWVCWISKAKICDCESWVIRCYCQCSCILTIVAVKFAWCIISIKCCTTNCNLVSSFREIVT